ncbi:glucoamylase family protein [Sphingobacterium sp.]|uniref:glucoamylase family protein n=1 Tax=Sphingobacterium sp. TaxID=341027 RepID=UPI0028A10A00|nr:glucoamylase family protein [Sphingobacterium sp.]
MLKKYFYFIFVLILPLFAKSESYPEVLFDNSVINGSYAKSIAHYTGESWIQNVSYSLPVSDSLFFTPGNSLSLRYVSSVNGKWEASILNDKQKFAYLITKEDQLTFKLFIQSNTKKEQLPKVVLQQNDTRTRAIEIFNYIDDFAYDTWLNVSIPVSKFEGIVFGKAVSAMILEQNGYSAQTHQLFIDQIEFLPKNYPKVKLSSAAILSKISSVDKQVELVWQLPLTPSIRYVKIYRSEDKVNYQPISILPIYVQKSLDRVNEYNKTYYYKIAWVDYNYVESPFSEAREIQVKKCSDTEMLNFIRNAHVNYFIDNYDVNSGMFMPDRGNRQAIVSTNETSYAILGLLVASENNLISRQALLARLTRIVKFLGKAQQHQGVFTSFYDGRLGVPYYRDSIPTYDVRGTSHIMESLLIARQYFSAENPEEQSLRNNITKLWERINWNYFTDSKNADVLWNKWSPIDSTARSRPLGGFNESLSTYLLAMSSPTHPLAISAYTNGFATKHKDNEFYFGDEFNDLVPELRMKLNDSISGSTSFNPLIDGVENNTTSIYSDDKVIFAKNIAGGSLTESLMSVYRPFLIMNPKGKVDDFVDYKKYLSDYILAYKRRDNELNIGTRFTDIWGVENVEDAYLGYLVNPAISIAAYPFEREIGLKALRKFYEEYADVLFTQYGFRSWIDIKNNDVSESYRARNQATIAVMIDNANSGMIWKLYEDIPEIKKTLEKVYTKK